MKKHHFSLSDKRSYKQHMLKVTIISWVFPTRTSTTTTFGFC